MCKQLEYCILDFCMTRTSRSVEYGEHGMFKEQNEMSLNEIQTKHYLKQAP